MSSEFVWDPSRLALNVEEMDAEHRHLIELMNRLHQLVDGGAPAVLQGKAFAALADYTEKHFRHEEAYMRQIGYPDLEIHQGVHRKLMGKLNAHALSFKQTGHFGDDLFSFLHMWLRSHICGIDSRYAAHVHTAAAVGG